MWAACAVRSSVRTGAADSCLHAPMLGFWGGGGSGQQQSSSSASLQRMQTLAREGEGEAEASERRATSEQQAYSGTVRWGHQMQMGPETRWQTLTGQGWVRFGWEQRSLVALEDFCLPEALELLRLGGWWLVFGVACGPGPAILLSCWLWASPADSRALDWATNV